MIKFNCKHDLLGFLLMNGTELRSFKSSSNFVQNRTRKNRSLKRFVKNRGFLTFGKLVEICFFQRKYHTPTDFLMLGNSCLWNYIGNLLESEFGNHLEFSFLPLGLSLVF